MAIILKEIYKKAPGDDTTVQQENIEKKLWKGVMDDLNNTERL